MAHPQMKILRSALVLAIILVLPVTAAWSYTDGPTSDWFKALSSPYTQHCCDQADCHLAQADYHDGSWWALSNRTGMWVRIEPDQITSTVSIFPVGVLCEGDPFVSHGAGGSDETQEARVYCFAPPPIGF